MSCELWTWYYQLLFLLYKTPVLQIFACDLALDDDTPSAWVSITC